MKARLNELFTSQSEIVIIGQADYVTRMHDYIRVIWPGNKMITYVSYDLKADKPDDTEFNFNDHIDQIKRCSREVYVVIAFSVKFHEKVKKYLSEYGFLNFIFYDSELDNELKKLFFTYYFKKRGIQFENIDPSVASSFMSIYMARSIYDKAITERIFEAETPYIQEIQVGAALTSERICALTDDQGENISVKNKRYCEMTGAYWAWKHSKAKYIGLCHYRRRFNNLESIAIQLINENADGVLPLPTLAEHSVYEDYLKKHIRDVYPVMLDVLKENTPDYYTASKEIFADRIFYASNMWILRQDVLDEFFTWMFPLIFEMENRITEVYGLNGDLPEREYGQGDYYNRYAGFVSERLTTLYFLKNADKYKILHATKSFLS